MNRWPVLALAVLAVWPGGAGATHHETESRFLSGVRQLTFEGRRAGEGYFSSDGRSMIFQSEREPGNPFYQMYVLDLETGDTRRVSPGHGKTTCGWIHPDGHRVLFASTQDDPEARAKQQAELDFRASGQKRRYSWDYDETYDIQEYDLESGRYRNLTRTPGYDAEGAYSPDGTRIVFASNRAAYGRPLTANEARRLDHDKSYFMDLYVMNADGSDVRQLTDAPGYDGGPFFSFDGRKIVWRRFSPDGSRAEVFTMNADGSEQRRITRLGAMSWAPFFHPSGAYVIFATNLHGFGNFELYLVDAEGRKEPVRVTHTDGFDGLAAFSPDGRTLTWTSNRTADKTSQIFVADWDHAAALAALGLDGAPAAPATADTADDIAAADLRRHVEALASEAMDGRLTGTDGERRATEYVAAAFRALGLAPAGEDGTYFQAFTFTAGSSLGPGNTLTVDGDAAFTVDDDWRPLGFSRGGEIGPAGVAFAGYGIVAPGTEAFPRYDSYAGLDVSGRWVLVFRGLPEDAPPALRTHLSRYGDLQYKAAVAKRAGALGLIVAPGPTSGYREPLVRLAYDAAGGTAGIAAVSVTDALARRLLAPSGKDLADLQAALDGGRPEPGFAVPDIRASARIDIVRHKRTGRNVIARLDTGAPQDAPALVIGAHVDHLGRGQASGSRALGEEKDRIHPGADDNASGVAALIEIAQALVAERAGGRLKAKRGILFAAWSGEELGLLGSTRFTRDLAERLGGKSIAPAVAAYLNMDMVGRLDKHLYLFGTGSSTVWGREIERRNVPVGLSIVTKADSFLPTDATAFYLAGVPILHAFTGSHAEYSTPRDTPDRLNYEGLARVARLMAGIGRGLARADEVPDYVEQDRPEGSVTGSRRRSTVYLGTIPDYAEEGVTGVRISGAAKGGPADRAGLAGGDVIVRLAGTDIENIYDYVNALNGLKVGTPVDMVVVRDGRRVTLTVVPTARE